jgi:glycosyltransferase involved in cell wall biosynthesis
MRVVYISFSKVPSTHANSVHVMKMSAAISSLGNNITLLTRKQTLRSYSSKDIMFNYGIRSDLTLVQKYYPEGPLGWIIYGINCISYVLKTKPDIVYSRDPFSAYLSALFNFDTIFECHSVAIGNRDKILFPKIFNNRSTRKIVVISKALSRLIKKDYSGVDKGKIIVAHDGVDLESYENTSSPVAKIFIRQKSKYTIGYFGSFYKGRGIDQVLQIAKRLKHLRFVLIGGSENEIRFYRNIILQEELTNVILSKFIPNREVSYYLKECSILLMPYQSGLEVAGGGGDTSTWMSPLKMFEYMASKIPIISSNLPVLKEILDDGHNSLLVEPNNIEAWTSAISRLCNDSALRLKLASNAYRDVQQYSWDERAKQIVGNYSK